VDDLDSLTVQRTYVEGTRVAENGSSTIERVPSAPVNRFAAEPVDADTFRVGAEGPRMRVIEAADNQLTTDEALVATPTQNGHAVPDPERDLLKLGVVNRYAAPSDPAVAFIRGFGLERGALASSVAHDSHNIVAVGASDAALAQAVNAVIGAEGGISVAAGGAMETLPLPIAGLMSDQPADTVARRYTELSRIAQNKLGSRMDAPFMTLSFMALLVIPQLKLSDQGLFDGEAFEFTDLFVADE
jgi:adenine deaminase